MLPFALPAKSTLIAAIAAMSITALPATEAQALGEKDKAFLAGLVTALVIDGIVDANKKKVTPPPTYVAPPPVYVDPAPVYTSIGATPAGKAFNSYTKAERKAIQRQLKLWGYYHGAIDGSFGRGTYNAVTALASDEGMSLKTMAGAFSLYDGLIY